MSVINQNPSSAYPSNTDHCSSIDNQLFQMRADSSTINQIYIPDIVTSGYTGHIPKMQEKFGKNIKNLFLESLIGFENDQTHKRDNRFDFKLQRLLQDGYITKQDLPIDSLLHYTREHMPLRPISKYAEPFQCERDDWKLSIYKMCNNNYEKRFISGYQGHCPRLLHRFGKTYSVLTHDALNDFTDIYRQKMINNQSYL